MDSNLYPRNTSIDATTTAQILDNSPRTLIRKSISFRPTTAVANQFVTVGEGATVVSGKGWVASTDPNKPGEPFSISEDQGYQIPQGDLWIISSAGTITTAVAIEYRRRRPGE